ncbi:MAG: potassium transporter TrkG [Fibrobacterota bacterium]
MKQYKSIRFFLQYAAVKSSLLTLASLPLLFLSAEKDVFVYSPLQTTLVFVSITTLLWGIFHLSSHTKTSRFTIMGTLFLILFTSRPLLADNPLLALILSLAVLYGCLYIQNLHFFSYKKTFAPEEQHEAALQRARWALRSALGLSTLLLFLLPETVYTLRLIVLGISIATAMLYYLRWVRIHNTRSAVYYGIAGAAAMLVTAGFFTTHAPLIALAVSVLLMKTLPRQEDLSPIRHFWWERLTANPPRTLVTTFSILCITGTLLLLLPGAARPDISVIDALFTATSAVCVTGLIVLDTPADFTFLGQFFILLLIQLGGLGIMSITTMGIGIIGKRLSFQQEKNMSQIMDTHPQDLFSSLKLILLFTTFAELIGAIILTTQFYRFGDPFFSAVWRGIFTSISAFCNAGFALQSTSIIPYQENFVIMHTVALLIIVGGMAPATTVAIPKIIRKKPVPLAPKIILSATGILLIGGTILLLMVEWNGMLAHMSIGQKLSNAWFQSATLRTAGFNSLDLSPAHSATILIMCIFMFIGGSPGGTAGGIKTTSAAVLLMCLRSRSLNQRDITCCRRRVSPLVISTAAALITASILTGTGVLFILELTQDIPFSLLIFETFSALGTVGLSLGATGQLDEIGKLIIVATMFAGRVMPFTLFMLTTHTRKTQPLPYADGKIPLT